MSELKYLICQTNTQTLPVPVGPFTPIFIASNLSGHSDHNHKWNGRAISLWCTQSWGKSKQAQSICGLTQQRTVFAWGYSSWAYWFLKQLTHISSWSIYSFYQYMFRQWQSKIRTALAFTVVKILERIKIILPISDSIDKLISIL